MALPTLVGTPSGSAGLTDGFSVSLPAGLAADDYVLVQVVNTGTLVETSGTYTLIHQQNALTIWGKKLGPGDTGTTTVDFTGAGTTVRLSRASVWRDVDTATPYESLVFDTNGAGATTRTFLDLITTDVDRVGVIFGSAGNDFPASSFLTANGWGNLGSFVDATTQGSDASLWHFTQDIAAPGTVAGPVIQSGAGNFFIDAIELALIGVTAGGGIVGTASITEARDTIAATGTIDVSGVATITEARDTIAATGAVSISGVAAITEARDILVATSGTGIDGTASITEARDTIVATGAIAIAGVAAVTEARDTLVATAELSSGMITALPLETGYVGLSMPMLFINAGGHAIEALSLQADTPILSLPTITLARDLVQELVGLSMMVSQGLLEAEIINGPVTVTLSGFGIVSMLSDLQPWGWIVGGGPGGWQPATDTGSGGWVEVGDGDDAGWH